MSILQRLGDWLHVRPHEVRNVSLLFAGAFLIIAFLVLGRSLREALYLTAFDVETLPYITAAVALLSVPTVGYFARLLARHPPKAVLKVLLLVIAVGLAPLWPFATRNPGAMIAFYLWTALGTLLLTSGFWVVTSEYFAVRGAKRLFGLIGAGGTAGAMVMGNSLSWLTRHLELIWLIPLLIAFLGLFYLTQRLLPALDESRVAGGHADDASMQESCLLAWRSPHLRLIGLIVLTATVATTMLDYQFKEFVSGSMATPEGMASFFGAFYGWTGAISLFIQLAVAARFLTFAGIASSLALLPFVLLAGSVGMLIVPSLILVTLVRGADNSLRKSMHRSVLELLYVPVPSLLRRKTKTFIDSVVDAVGEGLGAGIVFLWVTLNGLPSRYLSAFIAALAAVFLVLSRRMGRQYFATVREGLERSGQRAEELSLAARLEGRDLLSGSFTRLDIRSLIDAGEVPVAPVESAEAKGVEATRSPAELTLERLASGDITVVARTLEETQDWEERHIPALARLLARDPLFERALLTLSTIGEPTVPHLADLLADESTDFVIRRRIPRVLARIGGRRADRALLQALSANRFEVRYRAAIALVRRRRRGLPESDEDPSRIIWAAVRTEVGRDRPVWELQKLLDDSESDEDMVARRVGARGELSLEHTFRLLSLVLEPEPVRAAFHGVLLDDENLKSFSLEYLEQALPTDVRNRLWPFIGDFSEYQQQKSMRPIGDVVSDLMETDATLFDETHDREALRRILEERDE